MLLESIKWTILGGFGGTAIGLHWRWTCGR